MPWPDRLTAALRRLYRASEHIPEDMSSPPGALEQQLLARHARRWPAPAPAGGLRAFLRAHRLALSGAAATLALAAACVVPVDYDRNFGATVWCGAPGADAFAADRARDLADRLQAATLADQIAIRGQAERDGPATLRIDLWGADPELAAEVARAMADEPDADCRVEPLVGTVHGTLGGRLGHELFDLDLVDRADAEAARKQILEQLEARGLRGDAEVEITDLGDGRREVKIRVEAEHELTAP